MRLAAAVQSSAGHFALDFLFVAELELPSVTDMFACLSTSAKAPASY